MSKLGQGGMGSVSCSEHIELGTPAAIKLIDPSVADNEDALARFERVDAPPAPVCTSRSQRTVTVMARIERASRCLSDSSKADRLVLQSQLSTS